MKKHKKLSIKDHVYYYFAAVLAALLICYAFSYKSEKYIRDRVVMLTSQRGSCSGEQVRAPSGKDYILSAAHCKILADKNGDIEVTQENGKKWKRRILEEDANSDLLLLDGIPRLRGLDVAKSSFSDEAIRTFTHGAGLKTYKTEGLLIDDVEMTILVGAIDGPKSKEECSQYPKNKVAETIFGEFCILDVQETLTTALVVPGSSGGMAVNSVGDLVGVVSAGSDHFGALVTLKDIKLFLLYR